MRFLYWIISIPLAVLIAVFAVSNRTAVTLSLWPLPYEVDLPLFLPIMVAFLMRLSSLSVRRMDSELKRIKTDDETPKTDQKALGHS